MTALRRNINAARELDDFLEVMPKYHCRILFTARSRYESRICPEAGELMAQELLKLTGPVLLCRRKGLWVLMISLAAPRMVEIKRPLTLRRQTSTRIRPWQSQCWGISGNYLHHEFWSEVPELGFRSIFLF